MIKTYLGAGVHSCFREERKRQQTSSGFVRAWQRSHLQGEELSSHTTSVLLGFFRAIPITQHQQGQSHRGPLSRVCQAAALLQLSVISCHTTPQICSRLLQVHLCSFCVTAEGQGDRSHVRSGLSTYQWNLFLQHMNLNAQHLSTNLSTQQRRKKPLWLLWCHQQYRSDIASSRKMSLPMLLALMSRFLCNWLSWTFRVC